MNVLYNMGPLKHSDIVITKRHANDFSNATIRRLIGTLSQPQSRTSHYLPFSSLPRVARQPFRRGLEH